MDQQIALDLETPRKRVRLVEDAPVNRRAVLIDHDAFHNAIGHMKPDALELREEYSPWVDCGIKPPETGMWELRPYKNDRKVFRAHYNVDINGWTTPEWPFPVVSLAQCEWRGLAYDPKLK